MDFDKIKVIRSYVKKITKFKKLEKFQNMSSDDFGKEMAVIFPDFSKNYSKVFELVTHNEDLGFLKLMFKKLEDIEKEFAERYEEANTLEPIIKEIRKILSDDSGVTKEDLVTYIESSNSTFLDTYPIIIDRLLDKEYSKFTAEDLLQEQIKYNHEIEIGNELANKYIYPKINK